MAYFPNNTFIIQHELVFIGVTIEGFCDFSNTHPYIPNLPSAGLPGGEFLFYNNPSLEGNPDRFQDYFFSELHLMRKGASCNPYE